MKAGLIAGDRAPTVRAARRYVEVRVGPVLICLTVAEARRLADGLHDAADRHEETTR